MRLLRLRDLVYLVPASVAVGAALAAAEGAPFLSGWLGFTALFLLGGAGLVLAVRWSEGGKAMVWWVALALGLRLATGTALQLLLPIDGYDEPDDRAGYVFTDAHRRDDQAWGLAHSDASILSAFDRGHYTDQYGGLLALSALAYRIFSADAHRPLVVLVLAALTAALGVPFFWKAAASIWTRDLAWLATAIYCIYPESVLTGGAQMREPFLLTFISFALWGYAAWLTGSTRASSWWLALGTAGLIAVSPGVALGLVLLLVIWAAVRGDLRRIRPAVWMGGAVLFFAAFLFLAWSLGNRDQAQATPVGTVAAWVRESVAWVAYQLERGSGQVQNVFSKLPQAAQFGFVVAYGVTQPLLPPAFLEPTTTTWHAIGIFRSAGWYAALPLLAYAAVASAKKKDSGERRVWVWLTAFSWFWVVLSAIRAGGDQWDNPRYRLIFFGVQALVIGMAWLFWREDRNPWLPRILAVELWCLAVFSQWYLARYFLLGPHFPILSVMTAAIVGTIAILLGGAVWDRQQRSAKNERPGPAASS